MAIRVTQGLVDGRWRRGDVVDGYDADTEAFLVSRGVAEYVDGGQVPQMPAPEPAAPAKAEEPSYKQLQARARELGIPAQGKRAELEAAIAEAEAELEDDIDDDEPPALSAEVPE